MVSFFSSEPTPHIEPAAFVAHYLAHHGLAAQSFGLRQTVVVTLIPALERRLLRQIGSPSPHPYTLQRQTLYNPEAYPFSAIASPMGAPMAVMLLEQLIALGAQRFVYLGFCGALAPSYHIGDGFIPSHAIREEGTSYHYLPADVIPQSSTWLNASLHAAARAQGLSVGVGPIWTTDAPYRETPQKIRQFQDAGVHTVDMEMAALFAVAQYRGCDLTALLVVSDECYHPTWKPGFGVPQLRQGCRDAVQVAIVATTHLATSRI
jgi:nucleoside phosphorylase